MYHIGVVLFYRAIVRMYLYEKLLLWANPNSVKKSQLLPYISRGDLSMSGGSVGSGPEKKVVRSISIRDQYLCA